VEVAGEECLQEHPVVAVCLVVDVNRDTRLRATVLMVFTTEGTEGEFPAMRTTVCLRGLEGMTSVLEVIPKGTEGMFEP